MYGNIRQLNTAEHGLVRASLFAHGHGKGFQIAEQAPAGKFAAEPHGKARNVTAGVQDWSVGPLYPCAVQAVGDHECTQFQASDLHDDGYTFERRATYAEAEADARAHLGRLQDHGRVRAKQIHNLHHAKGGVSWAAVAA